MKKQILILALFVLALFANVTRSYGQLTGIPAPRPIDITCLPNDALHPIPGNPYNYIVNVPTPAGTKEYNWIVTTDIDFIKAGVLTTNIEAKGGAHIADHGTGYNDPVTGAATLSITWKSFVYDPANPVFVVIQVKSTVAGECNPNNLKVFRIEPVNAFTLDIANVKLDKSVAPYETNIDRCISDIVSAKYDMTAKDNVIYDFGTDYLYYVVTAANFSTSWKPSLKVTAIDPLETVTAVEWALTTDFGFTTAHAMPLSGSEYISTDPVPAASATGTVGQAGESILIRVTIDHTGTNGNYQGLTDETVTVAVDGKTQLALATPLGDVHFSKTVGAVTTDCGIVDNYDNDIATQIIKARPDIQSVTPSVPGPGNYPFLPVKP